MVDRKVRVRLFNVKYSPNLGDGLLSECLELAMRECGSDVEGTYSIDLSARTQYEKGSSSRSMILKALDGLPKLLRPMATALPREALMLNKWRPHYDRHLAEADAIAVGGGNLLTDMDLNFPLKVSTALERAAARGLPTAIYGVGVSSIWSDKGMQIFRRALRRARPVYVSVRDASSKKHFDKLFAEAAGREALVVRDPGLMIARFSPARKVGTEHGIGLCVTSSVAIRYHSKEAITDAELGAWYVGLCKALSDRGQSVVAFTNGSPEDEVFLDYLLSDLRAASLSGFERRRLDTPSDLVALVSSLSALVAHRMHAVIAAVSLGVPVFALLWDEKVESFMRSVAMVDATAFARTGNEEDVADRVVSLANTPILYDRQELVDEAFNDASMLFKSFSR